MEIYGLSLRIQSECEKLRTRKTPNKDTFHLMNHFIMSTICCKTLQKTRSFPLKISEEIFDENFFEVFVVHHEKQLPGGVL